MTPPSKASSFQHTSANPAAWKGWLTWAGGAAATAASIDVLMLDLFPFGAVAIGLCAYTLVELIRKKDRVAGYACLTVAPVLCLMGLLSS